SKARAARLPQRNIRTRPDGCPTLKLPSACISRSRWPTPSATKTTPPFRFFCCLSGAISTPASCPSANRGSRACASALTPRKCVPPPPALPVSSPRVAANSISHSTHAPHGYTIRFGARTQLTCRAWRVHANPATFHPPDFLRCISSSRAIAANFQRRQSLPGMPFLLHAGHRGAVAIERAREKRRGLLFLPSSRSQGSRHVRPLRLQDRRHRHAELLRALPRCRGQTV